MKTKHIAFILILITLSSCSDFLKEYSQDTAYVRSHVDLDELLLGSGYMSITSLTNSLESNSYFPFIHMMADEMKENINTTEQAISFDFKERYFGWYTWQYQPGISEDGVSITSESNDWNLIYRHISIVNMVLAVIDDQPIENDTDRLAVQRIKGEAHFLRGWYYFMLTNLYGKPYHPASASSDLAVPIKLTEYIEDKVYIRNTVQEVYDQVISDLSEAEELLAQVSSGSKYRANIHATNLLKARVYLYMQDWEQARTYSRRVMEQGPALGDLNTFLPSPETGEFFLSVSTPEVIFTMGPGEIARFINGHPTNMSMSDELYGLYEDNDLRKTLYVNRNATIGYVDYIKVDPFIGRAGLSDNFVLRTAEAYLINAEASAYAGLDGEARSAINAFRQNRLDEGSYADVAVAGQELVTLIRDERRKELCLEGHRWFDLRRYTVCEPFPYSKRIYNSITTFEFRYVGAPVYGYQYFPIQTRIYELLENDPAYTFPIPREVLDFNTGMPNNERPDRPPFQSITY